MNYAALIIATALSVQAACAHSEPHRNADKPNPKVAASSEASPEEAGCVLVDQGYGPVGTARIQSEVVVDGLRVPWGAVFLDNDTLLVTERAGRVRLIEAFRLQAKPVLEVPVTSQGEGGLLGIELHPNFDENRLFYLYYTGDVGGETHNRVVRYKLDENRRGARFDRVIVDRIPAARFHDGGYLRFGPDQMLYIGTGDAGDPSSAQDRNALSGKILRVHADGSIPADNPWPGNPAYVVGIRNTQGFDWTENGTLIVADHGPSGEFGWYGHDEVSVAAKGANLGWPRIYGCQTAAGMRAPLISWKQALPPGGAVLYKGDKIPAWKGSFVVGALKAMQLHRLVIDRSAAPRLRSHERYLTNEYGRIRSLITGPDGRLYFMTSNCDGRGTCSSRRDVIVRVTQ